MKKTHQSTYTITTMRMYSPDSFSDFVKLCRKNCTSATRELNIIIEYAVKNNIILSDLIK